MLSEQDLQPVAVMELWKIPTTAEEVFELISPDAVRKLKRDQPGNLRLLFTQAVAHLCQVVSILYTAFLFKSWLSFPPPPPKGV